MRNSCIFHGSTGRGTLLSLASAIAVSSPLSGADILWTAATGDFAVGTNWSGGVAPAEGDNAVIDNEGTAQIGANAALAGLFTGFSSGGGTFDHTGGDLTLSGDVRLGIAAGTGGSLLSSGGSLQQQDGDFILAEGAGSTASFDLAQNISFTRGSGPMIVGKLGAGTFTMAGSLTSGGEFLVGDRSDSDSTSTGIVTHSGGTFVSNGGIFIGRGSGSQGVGGIAGTYALPGAVVMANGPLSVGTAGASGLLDMSNGFIGKSSASPIVVGEGDGAEGVIDQSSGFINCGGDIVLGSGDGASGSYLLQSSESGNPAITITGSLIVGQDGGAGVLDLKGGSITKVPPGPDGSAFAFASGGNSTATITMDSGRMVNFHGDTLLGAAGNGTATWTISGTAEAVVLLLELGHADTATGTLNLDGGVLSAHRVAQGASSASSTFNFNGGILRAGAFSDDFMSGISTVNLKEGGANIDTNGFDITIGQTFSDQGGGLFKDGEGKLTLGGTSAYAGDTVVQRGTLAVNGSLPASAVWVNVDGTLAGTGTLGASVTVFGTVSPGDGGGELTVEGNVEFPGGLLKPVFGGSSFAPLAVEGELNIEGATLDLEGTELPAGTYTIATYGSVVGEGFFQVLGLPAGFDLSVGGGSITISGAPVASPYETWAATNGLEGEDAAGAADPDKDGIPNAIEFVVGGDPNATGDHGKLPAGEVVDSMFVFTFRRTDESAGTAPLVEYGLDLEEWNTAEDGADGVSISVSEDAFAGGDLVSVAIPMGAEPLFVRLNAGIP